MFPFDQSTALQMVALLDFRGVTGTPVTWKLLNIEERTYVYLFNKKSSVHWTRISDLFNFNVFKFVKILDELNYPVFRIFLKHHTIHNLTHILKLLVQCIHHNESSEGKKLRKILNSMLKTVLVTAVTRQQFSENAHTRSITY